MSILERFSTIIKANINDLLDRAEDPAKMMDQYMRQLMSDLADVKRETASVMAEESRIQRQLEEKRQESAKNADLARRALQLSNEDDARVFLAKKQELEKRIEELQKMYDVAHENSMRMRQVHDKLVADAETLRQRREAIQSKMALARAQEKAANVMGSHHRRRREQARRRDRPHGGQGRRDARPLERDAVAERDAARPGC